MDKKAETRIRKRAAWLAAEAALLLSSIEEKDPRYAKALSHLDAAIKLMLKGRSNEADRQDPRD